MKKTKWFAILGVLALTLAACSESGYTPTTTLPYSSTQTAYANPYTNTNPYYNPALNGYQYAGQRNPNIQFYNPYLANNNQFYSSCNPLAQLQLQFRAQPMFVCQSRMNMPSFYAYTNQNSNCWLRRQPTNTPNHCACPAGNCDCPKVLDQLRSECTYTQYTNPRTTSSYTSSSSGSTDTNQNASTDNNSNTDATEASLKSISPTIVKADAKALYDRLTKEAEVVKIRAGKAAEQTYRCMMKNSGNQDSDYVCAKTNNPHDTQIIDEQITGAAAKSIFSRLKKKNEISSSIKTGTNYKCISDSESTDDYACDYEILKSDGSILIQSPISPLAMSTFPPEAINTATLAIPALDQNANHEGTIKIAGTVASFIYDKIAVTETSASVNGIATTVKLGKQIKCTRTATPSNTECQIKIKSDTGDALSAS